MPLTARHDTDNQNVDIGIVVDLTQNLFADLAFPDVDLGHETESILNLARYLLKQFLRLLAGFFTHDLTDRHPMLKLWRWQDMKQGDSPACISCPEAGKMDRDPRMGVVADTDQKLDLARNMTSGAAFCSFLGFFRHRSLYPPERDAAQPSCHQRRSDSKQAIKPRLTVGEVDDTS